MSTRQKNLVLGIALLALVAVSSCSRDPKKTIVGSWLHPVKGTVVMTFGADGSYSLVDTMWNGARRGSLLYAPGNHGSYEFITEDWIRVEIKVEGKSPVVQEAEIKFDGDDKLITIFYHGDTPSLPLLWHRAYNH